MWKPPTHFLFAENIGCCRLQVLSGLNKPALVPILMHVTINLHAAQVVHAQKLRVYRIAWPGLSITRKIMPERAWLARALP